MRFSVLRMLALAVAWVFSPAGTASAAEEPWTLENVRTAFANTTTVGNTVCLVHDGWQIAFLSHNKRDIGAILITQQNSRHEHNLHATIQRLVDLTSLNAPAKMEMRIIPGQRPLSLIRNLSKSWAMKQNTCFPAVRWRV